MPRPSRPWFRFYVEACHDPKIRRLKPAERWLWVAVLAISRQSWMPGMLMISEREAYDAADVADFAAMSVRDVTAGLAKFELVGLIEREPNLGCWWIPSWNERQFESDDVSARVQRSRERRSNVPTLLPGTPPETETENRDRDRSKNAVPSSIEEAGPQAVDEQGLDEGGIVSLSRRTTSVAAAVKEQLLGASSSNGSNGKGRE